MVKILIDGIEYQLEEGTTVMQACNFAGVEIPHFCFHERLSIAGNCRMCLVEVEGSSKPVASCAMPVAQNMSVRTDSEMVHVARKGVMEFLLINHPLDCPVCDQGGECDLQDQALGYGRDSSRFFEQKRAVSQKDFGPLIKTHMTRCIHCTRCVRFMEEVAGVPNIGGYGRGEDMEITASLEQGSDCSEMFGNIIDLCPVGALTSKPYAFVARPWELLKTESVDVLDAVGSNIRIDVRDKQVMRITPRLHEGINQEWIGDKTRFAYDGLRRQRLDKPYMRKEDGKLAPVSWDVAFERIRNEVEQLDGSELAALAGDLCDAESMLALKDLFSALNCPNIDCRQDGAALQAQPRCSYIFNTSIAGIDKSDLCLLIGTNPRLEAPIINSRLRARWLDGDYPVANIGKPVDLTYPVEELGSGNQVLCEIIEGKHPFCKVLQEAVRPMLIVGQGALGRTDGANILWGSKVIAEKYDLVREGWNGFNVLHTAAARVGGLDLGLVPGPNGLGARQILSGDFKERPLKLLYLLGVDEICPELLEGLFIVYQGHHGDRGANIADVVLPGAAYTEKEGCYVNTEGRPQYGQVATQPPGDAREDWAILRALSAKLGLTLPYDSFSALREKMIQICPEFGDPNIISEANWGEFGLEGSLEDTTPYSSAVKNYFMTDPVSRASTTMLECTKHFLPTHPQKPSVTSAD